MIQNLIVFKNNEEASLQHCNILFELSWDQDDLLCQLFVTHPTVQYTPLRSRQNARYCS